MNLYQQQHQFYCGFDLHANKMYACVVDQDGKKRLHRNFHTRDTTTFLDKIEPFNKSLVVGCESTFNWYWLCDLCEGKRIPFVLGHALYLKAIHGGKVKNDKLDSEKLAMLLRGGNFTTAYAYPKKLRATRDLLRRRTHLMRRRAQTLTHTTCCDGAKPSNWIGCCDNIPRVTETSYRNQITQPENQTLHVGVSRRDN